MKKKIFIVFFLFVGLSLTSCSGEDIESGELQESFNQSLPESNFREENTPACTRTLYYDQLQLNFFQRNCKKASSSQIAQVNAGNLKKDKFLSRCYKETNSSCWCDQLIRPNPASIDSFHCTYGKNQVHQFIHPDESTWKHAIEAVKIVEEFEEKSLFTEIIYNWWRPEPYNKNVGGSATRHPYGTSIDVRFKTKSIQEKAFLELCKMRRKGRIRAIGYYASTALHFGIGDHSANTWGKSCP